MAGFVPDYAVVNSLLSIIWCCSAGMAHLMSSPIDVINKTISKVFSEGSNRDCDQTDLTITCEGIETLAVVFMLCPTALRKLSKVMQ